VATVAEEEVEEIGIVTGTGTDRRAATCSRLTDLALAVLRHKVVATAVVAMVEAVAVIEAIRAVLAS